MWFGYETHGYSRSCSTYCYGGDADPDSTRCYGVATTDATATRYISATPGTYSYAGANQNPNCRGDTGTVADESAYSNTRTNAYADA